MEIFLKATAGVLISLILYIVLSKQNKDHSVLLSMLICALLGILILQQLSPVFQFTRQLLEKTRVSNDFFNIMLRVVGIGIVAEFAVHICSDSGNSALGKLLGLLSTVIILVISLPLFETLFELIEDLLEVI